MFCYFYVNLFAFFKEMYYNSLPIGGVDMKLVDKIFHKKPILDEKNLLRVPYFGVKGSICEIREGEDCFYVTRWGISDKDTYVLPTPKKKKNAIYSNYINDVKRYLEVNEPKYMTSLSKQSKVPFSKKKIMTLLAAFAGLTTISTFGTIFITGDLIYLFLTTFFLGFVVSCYEINSLKDALSEEKRQAFIHEYREYSSKLNLYNIQKEKYSSHNDTRYSNLSKQNPNKVVDINLKKIKKFDNNVA